MMHARYVRSVWPEEVHKSPRNNEAKMIDTWGQLCWSGMFIKIRAEIELFNIQRAATRSIVLDSQRFRWWRPVFVNQNLRKETNLLLLAIRIKDGCRDSEWRIHIGGMDPWSPLLPIQWIIDFDRLIFYQTIKVSGLCFSNTSLTLDRFRFIYLLTYLLTSL